MYVLGGEIGYPAIPEDLSVEDITEPKQLMEGRKDLEAKVSFYFPDDDTIRIVRFGGTIVHQERRQPTPDDRKAVVYHRLARLFAEQGVTMEEFQEILKAAAWCFDYWNADDDLTRAVDKVIDKMDELNGT